MAGLVVLMLQCPLALLLLWLLLLILILIPLLIRIQLLIPLGWRRRGANPLLLLARAARCH